MQTPTSRELIKELLDTIYAMRLSLKVNQTPAEERAWEYLKTLGKE